MTLNSLGYVDLSLNRINKTLKCIGYLTWSAHLLDFVLGEKSSKEQI